MDERLTKALNLSYFYLKFRPRTEKEISEYLQKKAKRFKFEDSVIKNTLKSLKDDNLVNDKEFVSWFVERKSSRKPKSEFLLRRELNKHGIDKKLTDSYFEKNKLDEEALATQAASSRWSRWRNLSREKRFQKSASFLSRRGFTYDIIKKTIAKLEEEVI